jgi:hypothetical protein
VGSDLIMKKLFNSATLIGITVLVGGCSNNTIYFDLFNQTVNTCSGRSITSLYIEKSDFSEYGTFSEQGGQSGTSSFKINLRGGGYTFDSGSSGKMLVITPSSEFIIKNVSNGDAAASEIIIQTDSTGKVVSASATACD